MARASLIRFVTSSGVHPDSRQRPGLFCAAYELRDQGELDPGTRDALEDLLSRFSLYLAVPDAVDPRGIFWFKDASSRARWAWELATLLRLHDRPVVLLRTHRPGRIVYEDDDQVHAVPWRETFER